MVYNKKMFEVMLVFGSTFLLGQIVFLGWFHATAGLFAKGFLMFLIITLTAVRLGTHGTTAVLVMVAVQGLAGAITGSWYFANDFSETKLTS
jgi:hypothetical protein